MTVDRIETPALILDLDLHDFLYLIRKDKVINRVPITSRGKSI